MCFDNNGSFFPKNNRSKGPWRRPGPSRPRPSHRASQRPPWEETRAVKLLWWSGEETPRNWNSHLLFCSLWQQHVKYSEQQPKIHRLILSYFGSAKIRVRSPSWPNKLSPHGMHRNCLAETPCALRSGTEALGLAGRFVQQGLGRKKHLALPRNPSIFGDRQW